MAKIQDFINNKHKYKVDLTYQRPVGAWSLADKQCLIDTILRGEPMPMFFLNRKSDEGIYYIVDGQQRLDAIKLFYDNELKLNKKFSGEENHNKTFNEDNPISDDQRENFLNYQLGFHILEDYDDEKIRIIFSRLQRGKPLTLGERLNAKPGSIVLRMRSIAKHPFIFKSVAIANERYGTFPDAARILFYEKRGCKDSGTPAIISFFDDNRELPEESEDFKNIIKVLNFLAKCFPPDPGEYYYLRKHAWVFAVYTMIKELSIAYALKGQEDLIKKFISDFHDKVYTEDFRRSNQTYQRFYDNVRGGWSEKIIALRRDILIKEFLRENLLKEVDEKRQIKDEDKMACFIRAGKNCEICKAKFKDYKEPEYHHKEMYSEGGKTQSENIMVFCKRCHDKVHGKGEIQLQIEEEINEDEDSD